MAKIVALFVFWMTSEVSASSGSDDLGIHLASWNWKAVGVYLTITLFVVLSGLAKVVFHKLHWLSSRVPESWYVVHKRPPFSLKNNKIQYFFSLLVVVGVLMGTIVLL